MKFIGIKTRLNNNSFIGNNNSNCINEVNNIKY